ncbi:MAG: SpoIIE family protein phosphatase [Bacteroidota bacterium]
MDKFRGNPGVERVRYNVLTETLSDEEFAKLFPLLKEHHFTSGSTICDEDAIGNELYLVAAGRVNVLRRTADGCTIRLAVLHPGDFFGELGLLDGRPRSARVVAEDDCTVYSLDKVSFERLLHESHPFTLRMLQVISVRLRAMNNHVVKELSRCRQLSLLEISKKEQLVEVSRYLNSTLDLSEVLDRILATALRLVNGDRGTVYLLDEKQQELWSRVLTGSQRLEIRLPFGKGIAGYVAATGDTLNIADAYLDPRFNPDVDRQSGYHTQSMLCMPMRNNEEKVIGVFQLLNKNEGLFTSDDEQIIDAMSVHAAIAVENARLYEQEQEKLRLEKYLHAAREVQQALLPLHLPSIPGLELSASMVPAEEVGGDSYDFITMENGRLAVCLADVSGKGLPASLLMANLQAAVRSQSMITSSPTACLSRTNRLLYHSTASDKFVTAFYGIIDPAAGTLAYCNAGHESPLLVYADGSVHSLSTGGIMLGVLDDFEFGEESVPFPEGAVLVVFSDGITEALNETGEMYGGEKVREVVLRSLGLTASEILGTVLRELREFTGLARQSDDITIVVVKRPVPPTRS